MEYSNGTSRRRLGRVSSSAAGAFVYDGMRPAPLFSSATSFSKKPSCSGDLKVRRVLSSKDQNTVQRERSGAGVLKKAADTVTRKKDDRPEKKDEEETHHARVLAGRLLQWRFANARMEKTMARTTSAAQNKLFYTWLRVSELRNIHAAKRIVAQRRGQKLKLSRLLPPQLPLLASWDTTLAKPHADAVSDLARVLSSVCTSVPLTAGAQAGLEPLHETVFACVRTVNDIELATTDMFYDKAGATSSTMGELARTIQEEMEGLHEAMRLSRIITRLQTQELSIRANLVQAKQQRMGN